MYAWVYACKHADMHAVQLLWELPLFWYTGNPHFTAARLVYAWMDLVVTITKYNGISGRIIISQHEHWSISCKHTRPICFVWYAPNGITTKVMFKKRWRGKVHSREHINWLHHGLMQQVKCPRWRRLQKVNTGQSITWYWLPHHQRDLQDSLPQKGSMHHQRPTPPWRHSYFTPATRKKV